MTHAFAVYLFFILLFGTDKVMSCIKMNCIAIDNRHAFNRQVIRY